MGIDTIFNLEVPSGLKFVQYNDNSAAVACAKLVTDMNSLFIISKQHIFFALLE